MKKPTPAQKKALAKIDPAADIHDVGGHLYQNDKPLKIHRSTASRLMRHFFVWVRSDIRPLTYTPIGDNKWSWTNVYRMKEEIV